MKASLKPGIRYIHKFTIPESKTVPALYPESEEWACIKAINLHLDWPHEQTLGTHIDISHEAATPVGLEVTATVELMAVEGKKLTFKVKAHDGVDVISRGRHERFVINRERFDEKVSNKANSNS
jgi:fluoroacetyl-CoA thioesterase